LPKKAMNFLWHHSILFGLGGGEIFIVLLIVLLLFGPKQIPEIARNLGKGINEIKKAQREIKEEIDNYSETINDEVAEIQKDVEDLKKSINQEYPENQ
jgi:sec-independent protein translocase protein TatA